MRRLILQEIKIQNMSPITIRGRVYIGQKHQRGVAGDRGARRDNALAVDVTSASMNQLGPNKERASQLSPFFVGPIVDKASGLVAKWHENRWQYGKMWPTAGHIDTNGRPTPAWFEFRRKGYESSKAKRRPLPRKRYGNANSSFYEGRVYDYIESRKEIYVPEYAELIRDKPAMRAMQDILNTGRDILILDNDALPKTVHPQGRAMSQALWDEMINDASLPFGHGYVVAALLDGYVDVTPPSKKRKCDNDDK